MNKKKNEIKRNPHKKKGGKEVKNIYIHLYVEKVIKKGNRKEEPRRKGEKRERETRINQGHKRA